MNPPSLRKNSGLAIASLVLGLLGLCCPFFLPSIAAIVCGHIARGKIKSSGGALEGAGLALAGLILGYLTVVLSVIGAIVFATVYPKMHGVMDQTVKLAYATQIHTAVQAMVADGVAKDDKSHGWPADAGITTVTELKKRLIEGGYLTAEEAEMYGFENFLFGNLSAEDPEATVFIRNRPDLFEEGAILVRKDGEPAMFTGSDEIIIEDPPREPPYLAP